MGAPKSRSLFKEAIGNIPDWQNYASCANTDPDAFFVEPGGDASYAKRICSGCPVKIECLEQGFGEGYGVWGGRTERERRALKRRAA